MFLEGMHMYAEGYEYVLHVRLVPGADQVSDAYGGAGYFSGSYGAGFD